MLMILVLVHSSNLPDHLELRIKVHIQLRAAFKDKN